MTATFCEINLVFAWRYPLSIPRWHKQVMVLPAKTCTNKKETHPEVVMSALEVDRAYPNTPPKLIADTVRASMSKPLTKISPMPAFSMALLTRLGQWTDGNLFNAV